MNDKTRGKFFAEWNAAKKILREEADFTPDELEARLEEIKRQAWSKAKGCEAPERVSSKELTGEMVSWCLAAFAAVSRPGDLEVQLRALDDARRSRILGIEKTGLGGDYVAAVALDRFGTRDWRGLDLAQLNQLMMTIKSRARERRKGACA